MVKENYSNLYYLFIFLSILFQKEISCRLNCTQDLFLTLLCFSFWSFHRISLFFFIRYIYIVVVKIEKNNKPKKCGHQSLQTMSKIFSWSINCFLIAVCFQNDDKIYWLFAVVISSLIKLEREGGNKKKEKKKSYIFWIPADIFVQILLNINMKMTSNVYLILSAVFNKFRPVGPVVSTLYILSIL